MEGGNSQEIGPKNNVATVDAVEINKDRRKGLDQLKTKLENRVDFYNKQIELARQKDQAPRTGLAKLGHRIGNILGSTESHDKGYYGPRIEKNQMAIDEMNRGNDQMAIDNLKSEISTALRMGRSEMYADLDDLPDEDIFFDEVQKDVDILTLIDPKEGDSMQNNLNIRRAA